MKIVFTALCSIALSVMAQFVLKAGVAGSAAKGGLSVQTLAELMLKPLVIAGFALYGAGAVLWLVVLANWDVSKAYPLAGLGFLAVVFVGLLLGEQVNATRILGAILITTGVLLVSRS